MTHAPIIDLMLERRAQHPDAAYLLFGERSVTWQEFVESAFRAANGLRALGVEPGDRVAIMLPNSPEFLFVYYGIVAAGAAPIPINVAQRGNTLEYILTDSGAVAVVVDAPLAAYVRALAPSQLTIVTRGEQCFERLMSASSAVPQIPSGAPSGLGILYTSGTTGPPKGVVATGYDLDHVHHLLGLMDVAPGETIYTALPLYHGNALILSSMGAIWNDWRLSLAERFSASGFWDQIRRSDAVAFNALGAMIPILLKQPQRPEDADNPVRVCLSAACPDWAWETFERRFDLRLLEFYGLVDYPGYLINADGIPGHMGRPVGRTRFAVVDHDDQPVPPGVVGELVMQHPDGRLTHYHGDPAATEAAYRNGWFHTGDLAVTDASGSYRYAGRLKESIRRRGENISAWEIECAVNALPGVVECAAHAVPSEVGEDEVKLVVVLRKDAMLSAPEIVAYCHDRMAAHAVPSYVEFRPALPKTGTHRIDYACLRREGITASTWRRPEQTGG